MSLFHFCPSPSFLFCFVLFFFLVTQLCPTLCYPMDYSPPGSFCHWGFSRQECWSGLPCPPPRDLPDPGIEPRSPTLQEDSLLSEPLGKPMNTGVGSLSLLQQIFPTQESNQGLLHCRWILCRLSYQGTLCLSCTAWKLHYNLSGSVCDFYFFYH